MAPKVPLAPGLLSGTTVWPSRLPAWSAMLRRKASAEAPGGQGITSLMLRLGKSLCARATAGAANADRRTMRRDT